MTIMATLTMLRPAEDVGGDVLGNIVNIDGHDGADKAWLSETLTRTLTLLRKVKRLGSSILR